MGWRVHGKGGGGGGGVIYYFAVTHNQNIFSTILFIFLQKLFKRAQSDTIMDKSSWDSKAVFIFFCNFLGSLIK